MATGCASSTLTMPEQKSSRITVLALISAATGSDRPSMKMIWPGLTTRSRQGCIGPNASRLILTARPRNATWCECGWSTTLRDLTFENRPHDVRTCSPISRCSIRISPRRVCSRLPIAIPARASVENDARPSGRYLASPGRMSTLLWIDMSLPRPTRSLPVGAEQAGIRSGGCVKYSDARAGRCLAMSVYRVTARPKLSSASPAMHPAAKTCIEDRDVAPAALIQIALVDRPARIAQPASGACNSKPVANMTPN